MFKLDRKLIISASVAATVAILSGCMPGSSAEPKGESTVNGKATIDGGLVYPVVNDKTGPYYVNPQVAIDAKKIYNGRVPTANELKAWNTDLMPDGTGFPEGQGTAEEGEILYEAQCVMCHGDFGSGGGGYPALAKGNAYELQKTLTNNRYQNADGDGPTRVFGSYWPKVSTLWWYIRDGMPHPMSKTLSNNETYALTAYILNLNEIEIDGEMIEYDFVLNKETMLKIDMPNNDGFIPNIDGPAALDDVRAFYADPTNYGAQKVNPSERCMKDCQDATAKVTRIKGAGISEFLPPMATARDLPKTEGSDGGAKKQYEESCMMCHADTSMGAPALGDAKAWKVVTAKGIEKVYSNGINGINGMPPKGGSSLSDKDFKSVVDYMINQSK
jgi:S-disulfanyl-L-cysteine oxidoreductase SoxD